MGRLAAFSVPPKKQEIGRALENNSNVLTQKCKSLFSSEIYLQSEIFVVYIKLLVLLSVIWSVCL